MAILKVKSSTIMVKENLKNENLEIVFPEESSLVIKKILEGYGLDKIQKEAIKKFIDLPKEEKLKIGDTVLTNLPGAKISKIVKEYAEGKLDLNKISFRLRNDLNIDETTSEKMANELKTNLLELIQPIKSPTAKKIREKKSLTTETSKPKLEKKFSSTKDVYREPVE